MKKVLLAINKDDYNDILRNHLSPYFNVIPNAVYYIKYLYEFIDTHRPDIIIVHDRYFGLDAEGDKERENEWLKTAEYIRRKYDDAIRFVFLCERPQGDPFLSELVNRNVLDIFHHRNIDLKLLIEQLQDSPRYSKAAYLVVNGSKEQYKEEDVFAKWENEDSSSDLSDSLDMDKRESLEDNPLLNSKEVEDASGSTEPVVLSQTIDTIKEKEVQKKTRANKKESRFSLHAATKIFKKFPLSNKEDSLEEIINEKVSRQEEKLIKTKTAEEEKQPLAPIQRKPSVHASNIIIPKMIAVGSIHPGAGSTFLVHNLSRFLSDGGIPCSVVEAFNEYDALYHLFSAEQEPPDGWESLHYYISKGFRNASIPRWKIDDVTVFPQRNIEKESLEIETTKEILFLARQSPIVLVDISHNWNDPISQAVLNMCDELWCVTEPNPFYIRASEHHHKTIYQVADRVGEDKVLVIGNRWQSGIEPEELPEIFTKIPYFKENTKAINQGVPLYRVKPKLFKMFNDLEDRLCED